MGSIRRINNPKEWEIVREGNSKITKGDYVYQMEVGVCDDEWSVGPILEILSKENYENLLDGTYRIESFPYNEQTIIIFDKDNNIIPLVKGKEDEEYEANQKEYIKKLELKK